MYKGQKVYVLYNNEHTHKVKILEGIVKETKCNHFRYPRYNRIIITKPKRFTAIGYNKHNGGYWTDAYVQPMTKKGFNALLKKGKAIIYRSVTDLIKQAKSIKKNNSRFLSLKFKGTKCNA